jgi:hypothetical protein
MDKFVTTTTRKDDNKRARASSNQARTIPPPAEYTRWHFEGDIQSLLKKEIVLNKEKVVEDVRAWCRLCDPPQFVHLQLDENGYTRGLAPFITHLLRLHPVSLIYLISIVTDRNQLCTAGIFETRIENGGEGVAGCGWPRGHQQRR